MEQTFYFYDLETSGFSPSSGRIMQFGGQRTDMQMNSVGEPDEFFVQLTSDVLPEPDAILVTGITPQRTKADGLSEKEFCDYFLNEIAIPGTIFVGYNSIRFDDEFVRNTLYRNLRDPYEWQWKDSRSKWDLLDVIRMTRALRPDGINWPFGSNGKQANRLGLLADVNGIDQSRAHNALSDVHTTIAIAKLIQDKQPKLFEYLLGMRDKAKVAALAETGAPFVYCSGRYSSKYEKTSIVVKIGATTNDSDIVYDLRTDPEVWLADYAAKKPDVYSPLKKLKHNRCPAVAPLGVLDDDSWARIGLSQQTIKTNLAKVRALEADLLASFVAPDKPIKQSLLEVPLSSVDAMLYDGFVGNKDKKTLGALSKLSGAALNDESPEFDDVRLSGLYFLYRARQFPGSLLSEERATHDAYVSEKLSSGSSSEFDKFMARLNELAKVEYLDADKRYILEELALYGQSLVPLDSY
jgi:exodeoxyribonuclease I